MKITFSPSGRFTSWTALASVVGALVAASLAQTAAPSADPEKRLQWLNSRIPPKPAATPQPAPAPKIGFRSSTNAVGTRSGALETPAPRVTEKALVKTIAKASPSPAAKASPAPITKTASASKRSTPIAVIESTPERRIGKAPTTPAPKQALGPAITAIAPTRSIPASATRSITIEPDYPTTFRSSGSRRYPWKSNIVTTVFWVGEAPSGNNLTPNHASSWDLHWASNYGGFDNPDRAARRGYLPARFTPRLNPFYVALPYNDVTRGTTKPESRRVIPWFKEAFVREGQSVCRDRWVAVRNRAGKVAYAQWSDCGPFRTDHWQYVFGNERPRPNLNKGAGLDVSPALRDFLGLQSTDVTDWKFVEVQDVPNGPWTLYGQNNIFAMKGARPARSTADNTNRTRNREL